MEAEEKVLQDNKDVPDESVKKHIIGTKYYKFIGDDIIMIRLLRVKNADAYVVDANGTRCTMTKAEFESYRKLNPDGYVGYCIVEQEENIQDVLVSFHRRKDLNTKKQLPFAVCRQNLYDFFSNAINQEEGVTHIGCSISQESCPLEIEFPILLASNSIHEMTLTACYIEDTLSDLLKLVSTPKYDDVLYKLYQMYDKEKTRGACPNLKQLLYENGFINDVYRGFNELKVHFDYVPELMHELVHAVEDIVKYQLLDPIWIPFDRDVDLKAIRDEYLIIRDASNKLWVVSYKRGEYVNRPYFLQEDHTEFDTLNKIIQSKK